MQFVNSQVLAVVDIVVVVVVDVALIVIVVLVVAAALATANCTCQSMRASSSVLKTTSPMLASMLLSSQSLSSGRHTGHAHQRCQRCPENNKPVKHLKSTT